MDKEKIIQSIRKNKPSLQSMPDMFAIREVKTNLVDLFCENIQLVGAEVIKIDKESVSQYISANFPEAADFSDSETWKEYQSGNFKDYIEKLKTVVIEGQFGVAENAAIWVDETNFPYRIVPFIAQNLVVIGGANVTPGLIVDSYVDYQERQDNSIPQSKPPTLGNPSLAWIVSKQSNLDLKFRFTDDGFVVSQQSDGSVYALSVLSTFDMCPVQLVYFKSAADIQTQPEDGTNAEDPFKIKVTGATKFLLTNEGHLVMRNHSSWGVCWGNPPYGDAKYNNFTANGLNYGGLHIRTIPNLFTIFA